jgi:hypothetical protein
MIFKWQNSRKDALLIQSDIPKKRGPIPCDAVGFSLCLINAKILKKIPPPYFVTGTNNTEDVYFCIKAQNNIKDVKIICDTSIVCGHILGPEVIDNNNKKAYSRYHKTVYGNPDKPQTDRGEQYLNTTKGVIHAKKAAKVA